MQTCPPADITASATANGRYVEIEVVQGAITLHLFLTPEEVNELQTDLGSALDRLGA